MAFSVVIWFILIAAEILHGIAQSVLLVPHVGELRSSQIGVFAGSLIVLAIALVCVRRIFGPVWSVLYLSMAIAAWAVWRKGDALVPLILFVVQLVFNATWSWLFFGMHSPRAAFVDIVLLWIAVAATTIAFWRRSLSTGPLFAPYLAWVSFAAVLNFGIWRMNGQHAGANVAGHGSSCDTAKSTTIVVLAPPLRAWHHESAGILP